MIESKRWKVPHLENMFQAILIDLENDALLEDMALRDYLDETIQDLITFRNRVNARLMPCQQKNISAYKR